MLRRVNTMTVAVVVAFAVTSCGASGKKSSTASSPSSSTTSTTYPTDYNPFRVNDLIADSKIKFQVSRFVDPAPFPTPAPAGTRYVAVDVEVFNFSGGPLAFDGPRMFTLYDIHARDYRAVNADSRPLSGRMTTTGTLRGRLVFALDRKITRYFLHLNGRSLGIFSMFVGRDANPVSN